jgi:FtsP/CotA-like multicopper oxidase with cupredoxin domain
VTQEAVPPGGRYVYRFLADQVGTYWYHTHQVSSEGVRRGLFGALVVRPRDDGPNPDPGRESVDLTLPVHTYDGIVALGVHDDVRQMSVPPGTPVRLRLINTDSTPHRMSLVGTDFRVVAVDGYLVRVTVVNRSIETHPWHLHGHRVLVLGTADSPLWLDTFDVRPGEVWRAAFRADNLGIWMNHCHNLDHARQGMALHLSYEGVGSDAHVGSSHAGH